LFKLNSSIVEEMNEEIIDNNIKYQVLVRPIEGSATYNACFKLHIPALTFETCKKLPLSQRIEEHIKFIKIILFKYNMLKV
jgi:hypothetical protein